MTTTTQMTELLQCLRQGHGQRAVGLLSVEVLLHVSKRPQTIEELAAATGAQNAHVCRAVLGLTPHWNKGSGEVVRPFMHLLQRRKRPNARGYRVHLTAKGRELLGLVGNTQNEVSEGSV